VWFAFEIEEFEQRLWQMSNQSEKRYPSLSLSSFVPMEDWCHHVLQEGKDDLIPSRRKFKHPPSSAKEVAMLQNNSNSIAAELQILCAIVSFKNKTNSKNITECCWQDSEETVSHSAAIKKQSKRDIIL
jgi:hypothetical protein